MLVRSFDRTALDTPDSNYGLNADDVDGLPFELTYGSVPPGTSAERRKETDDEAVIVLAGTGAFIPPRGEPTRLAWGDAMHLAGYRHYALTAQETPLDYVSVSWRSAGRRRGHPTVTVRSLERDAMEWSYEMYLRGLYDAGTIPGLPFGSVFGSVPPGSVSKYHCHQDGEIFLVLGGRAEVEEEGEIREVGWGDLVFLIPFRVHGIRNLSDEPFDLVSLFWENIDAAGAALADRGPETDIPDRTVVFCPPPTPNGGLHLGHLAGPYLRADLYTRAVRTLGRVAHLVTGTDDHQSYVAATARRLGKAPAEVAGMFGDDVTATLHEMGVDATRVYRPLRDDGHESRLRALFDEVVASPAVVRTTIETPWCEQCGLSLHQAFACGACPACGEECSGEICEACGRPNDARDLVEITCGGCGAEPELRKETALVLDLDHFAPRLQEYLTGVRGSGQLRHLTQQLVESGLGSYRLTRDSAWGMDLAKQELFGQVMDPWVELALTQIDNAARFRQDGDAAMVTFLGFDNSYYYAVLLPAIALAIGRESALPGAFVTNRFLHLDGAKFSTSRGHAVWAKELMDEVPADVIRLALLRRSPEEAVVDLTTDEVAVLHDDPLLGALREWLAGFAELPGAGVVPGTGAWTPAHREFYRQLCLLTAELDGLLVVDAFSSVAHVEGLEGLVRGAQRFRAAERTKRLLTAQREEARTSTALEYVAAKAFAALAYPVMPSIGAELWQAIGLAGLPRRERHWSFVPSGTRAAVTVPAALLPR